MVKKPSYNFFHFTRKEKSGTLVLLCLIGLITATPFFYSLIFKDKVMETKEFENELTSLTIKSDSVKKYDGKYPANRVDVYAKPYIREIYKKAAEGILFKFDPNTLTDAGWKKLGVSDKTISTIKNYLSKGGKFLEPADIKKIWGLHEEQIDRMLPFVEIKQEKVPEKISSAEKKEFSRKVFTNLDINQADSAAYVSLPGIGPGFARRIIKFRERLGGFYSNEQVSETFGLPDSTFQKIKGYLQVSAANLRKININIATEDELKEHPYIRYQLAGAIIQYRLQHGNFSSVEDLKKIILVTDEIFKKLSPYLGVD